MRKSWGVLPILFIFTLLLVSLPLQAAQTGKIAGVITDAETGEALPGASVQIDGTMMGAATDQNGQFFILNVPPGNYTCNVMFMGYTTQKINSVKVQIDVTTRLDAKLSATVIEGESVSVIAERPVVDKTMTATKVSFSADVLDNVMPANSLDEILQTSVTTQSMRGGNKTGVAYMVDGVDVSDILYKTGSAGDGYTQIKRSNVSGGSSTGEFNSGRSVGSGRSSDMVQTVGSIAQGGVAEAEVIAGTYNAEYSASGGIVNIASKSGTRGYTAKLNVRSSLGGLDHAGPDVYNNNPDGDPNILNGYEIVDVYNRQKEALIDEGTEKSLGLAELLTWEDGQYSYGEDPRINSELYVGGPMGEKGVFFFAGSFLNDHGRLPGEFQRDITGSLKLNYNFGDNDNMTVYGKLDDGGKLGGWNNRSFTYPHMFNLELQAISQTMSYVTYAKWNHIFDAASYLDATVSYVGNNRTYGYKPNSDGELAFDDYGDDWLILDTNEKSHYWLVDAETRSFNSTPGNDTDYNVSNDFANLHNQILFGISGYHYEDIGTSTLAGNINYTRQINFHHQIKAGAEFKYNTIDMFQHKVGGPADKEFPFETVDYNVNPYGFGTFLQDKIEYEGIIVNLGLRFDGYNTNTAGVADLWNPVFRDTMANGQFKYSWETDDDSKSELRTYFSPRIGVSHPLTETAAMHYSWGMYTTQPNMGKWLAGYDVFANASLPNIYNPDPEPETATAYEIGVNIALSQDYGADLTAYYRDTRNAGTTTFKVTPDASVADFAGVYYYKTNYGYRDSRGLELTVWKRPQREMYWDIVGVSGNISVSYSYDKANSNGADINMENAFNTDLGVGQSDFDFDLVYVWPTYSRGYNDVNAKGTILLDFPMEFKLSNFLTYRSPWRYSKQLGVTNMRYEEKLDGASFFQWDLRLTKYFTIGKFRTGVFFEMLNVLDRENILSYETEPSGNNGYEAGEGAYSYFGRPVNQYGSFYTGIAREMYAGFEIAFE